MNLKHKVIKDFQYLSPDKKIFTLKAGTIIDEYVFKIKNESIDIDKDIIDNNPDFFEIVEWRAELLAYLKANKIPQPAVLSKKLIPFINEMLASVQPSKSSNNSEDIQRFKDKENEYRLRFERLERKEQEYLDDLKSLRAKEDTYRNDLINLSNKEIELQRGLKEISEKQRNFDIQVLQSINNSETSLDKKYQDIEDKIAKDFQEISDREFKLQLLNNELQENLKTVENLKSQVKEYNLYLDEKLSEIYNWKERVLNNWNYDLYPIPDFPIIEKRDFS